MASIRSGIGENMEDRYLFKAKRTDNGEWVIGNLITNVFFKLGQSIPYILCPDKAKYDCFEDFTEGNGIFEVRPDTICQCTGLDDKNGKLIWENDVCDRKEEYPEIVKYNKGDWTLDYSYSKDKESGYCYCNLGFYVRERKCVEAIGNIFDNPELLESEK
jgi:uncharacterized phage protein (TIGR01671 family)